MRNTDNLSKIQHVKTCAENHRAIWDYTYGIMGTNCIPQARIHIGFPGQSNAWENPHCYITQWPQYRGPGKVPIGYSAQVFLISLADMCIRPYRLRSYCFHGWTTGRLAARCCPLWVPYTEYALEWLPCGSLRCQGFLQNNSVMIEIMSNKLQQNYVEQ